MKKALFLFLLFISMSFYSWGQKIERSMVIDSVIYKKNQNKMILLHKIGENYYAGLHYTWRGLGHPQVSKGDTAVLVKNDRKSMYNYYVKIKYKQP